MKIWQLKTYGIQQKQFSKREFYTSSNTILLQETRKTSNRRPKTIIKRRTKTPEVSKKKWTVKIRAEINEKINEGNNSKDQ